MSDSPSALIPVHRDVSSFGNEVPGGNVILWWLGQAGFLIRYKDLTLLIDPYLSDFLAGKYRGSKFPHIRMMPPPLAAEALRNVDFCFCSHAHSDHMDPGFLPELASSNPQCRFVLPLAALETGVERGIPENRMIPMMAGRQISPEPGFSVRAVPSAHEELKVDSSGNHLFLGFVLTLGENRIYHSGDCRPYPELKQWLAGDPIDLALLPVNGRREELSREGIAGNFNFEEASELTEAQNIRFMIPHHYGMFDFNTVDPEDLQRQIVLSGRQKRIIPARTGIGYQLGRE